MIIFSTNPTVKRVTSYYIDKGKLKIKTYYRINII